MNIGIMGAGAIAQKMAETVSLLDGFTLYAIASRSIEKAMKYQEQYGFQKAYGSYEELALDPLVDLVYLATPHSFHYEQMLLCLANLKPVLCEKILTNSLSTTKDICQRFEREKVFLCEALWTSFLPSLSQIKKMIFENKVIGNINRVDASFIMELSNKERVIKKSLGGGVLMDIGLYPLVFSLKTFGESYQSIDVESISFNDEVDMKEELTINYGSFLTHCHIDGTKGNVTTYGRAVHARCFSEIPKEIGDKVTIDMSKLAKKVQKKKIHYSIKMKFLFSIMRIMQKKGWSSDPCEPIYWSQEGWLGKERPWKKKRLPKKSQN